MTVTERAGVDRVSAPITGSVPIPRGELADAEHCRLLADGKEVPAQFRVLGQWWPDKSVRFLLVDFQADVKAKESGKFVLKYGPEVKAWPIIQPHVTIDSDPAFFWASAGFPGVGCRISKTTFNLFDLVLHWMPASAQRPPASQPEQVGIGAFVRGLHAMVTRAVPAPANTGRSHLIFVNWDGAGGSHLATLKFVADRDYELTWAGTTSRGTWGKDFKSSDGHLAIPASAWLKYAYPKTGDVYTFATVPAGAELGSYCVYDSQVIESGPMRAAIRVRGGLSELKQGGKASAAALEFTAVYHFFTGSPVVKLQFTLENNNHGGRTDTGNAANADIGGINCVFFNEAVLSLRASGKVSTYGYSGEGHDVELYQDSSGGANWDRYRNAKFNPRPSSYVSFKGYRVYADGKPTEAAGNRRPGAMDVRIDDADSRLVSGVAVAVRDFWQNSPKSLRFTGSALEIGLFPGRYASDFPLRSGEHKTHEVAFVFRNRLTEKAGISAIRGVDDPLRPEVSPEWWARTRALGDIHPFDEANYKAYEVRNLSAIGVYPDDFKPGPDGKPSIFSRIEESNFYNWMDYGDLPIDFENPAGQWNLKYDLDYHMLQQYARTGRAEWWTLFDAAARHYADIDIHHQPHYPGLHYVKGGTWAHSLHDEPGNKNPHRNYNHFTKDLAFGARGTAALYYLTGNEKAREACIELCENAMAEFMSPQKEPDPAQCNRMGVRGDACTLERLIEGYQLTGDEKFLTRARWQIKSCAFNGKPDKHPAVSLWSSLFYMMALNRYVEMFPDDAAARGYLLAHLETLSKGSDPKSGIYYEITPQPDGSVAGKGTATFYNIMAADCLAIAYRLTGQKRYLDLARQCFDYGVKNANWLNGPPTYYHIHSGNGAMHGNTFMVVDSQEREKK